MRVRDGGKSVAEFEYDGTNRRVVNEVSSHTDHYYYNGEWQALEVRRDSGSGEDTDPLEQYVWHPYYIDALATRWYDSDTDGQNVVQHYFCHDANFNVTALLEDRRRRD